LVVRFRTAYFSDRGRFPTRDRFRVRRETGKEQVVKVHCDEGVAIHIDPESCVTHCEVRREALTGVRSA
jgi:hypothetical protein